MFHIILVRHGRTEWNREERFRGRADLDLDEVGVKQAEAAAGRVADWPISVVYSSPLRRAMNTAQALAGKLDLEVTPLPGIIDIDFGKWQGLSMEEAAADNAALFQKWLTSPHEVRFPGGESLEIVRDRIDSAVAELKQRHSDQTIVLVSHRVVCQAMVLYFLELDNSHFWQIKQDVCAINIFKIEEDIARTLLVNDTCHLDKLANN
ncbi:histidine phosphatase family protein [Chloroflexota bacterium]